MKIYSSLFITLIVLLASCSSQNKMTQSGNSVNSTLPHAKYSFLPGEIKKNVIVSYVDQPEKWVMIDKNGNEIHQIYNTGKWPDQYKDGLIRIVKNNKIGFINKEGEIIIAPKYNYASAFVKGKSIAQLNENQSNNSFTDSQSPDIPLGDEYWGIIDKDGKIIKPFIYTRVWDSSLKCFVYQNENEKFILTERGKIKSVF